MIGIDRYRTLASRNEGASWLRFDGGLTWDADDKSNRIAEAFAYEKAIGYDCRHVSANEVAVVTPGINAAAITQQGAIFNPGEGWVNLPTLIDIMVQQFTALGGQVISHAGKASVDIKGGRATGVSTVAGNSIEADAVLVATGAAVPGMAKQAGHVIADGTPIALLVKSKPFNCAVRAVLNTPDVALRPTPDGAIVCDSAWSEAELNSRPDGTYEVKDETIRRLLSEASRVLEGNPILEMESYHCGPKPVPGDGESVIGPLDGIEGYFVAFSHSGATLGLITGELIAREIVAGEVSPLLANFRPARFMNQNQAIAS
ncbi:glycine/D-amino acid oxidase-like deaminating enzyme [Rhizobium sp. PvP014]|nr:glycine/D-amino acid oxidase-like deaminating enzyme [Rhizobium sp. PvP014]MBP2532092.1 glycine/D-amino acid oxidase-like deaminating enzyme [Rhizobium sp. PvP099]